MENTSAAVELLIQENWECGDLYYKLHKAQRVLQETFENASGQLFVANCSRQWGKSFWAVTKAIECALSKPKAQIRYGAAFQSDLEEFIFPAFDIILDDCPEHLKPKFNSKTSSYIFPNKSRIKLVGLDKKPNGLRGNTLDLIIVDECGFVTNLHYIYTSVIVPSTLHRPNCRIILISTPPSTPAHAFVDYIQKAEKEGGYVVLDIYTNPLITEDDIERMAKELGGKHTTAFRRECLCELVTEDDLMIIPEWDNKYVQALERDEYYKYYDKYDGLDLGIKDLTAAIFGYYDFKKAALVIEDEFEMSGPSMNTLLLVNAIKEKEKELWANENGVIEPVVEGRQIPFRRVADTNWPLLVQDMSLIHGLTFIETSKETLEAMINEVRLWVQSGRIIIHPRCKKLIGCMRYGVWDQKKKAFARSTVYGHFDHLAALVYLVRNVATNSNPIPADHGFQNHTAWLGNIKDKKLSANAQTISKALLPKRPEISTSYKKKRGAY